MRALSRSSRYEVRTSCNQCDGRRKSRFDHFFATDIPCRTLQTFSFKSRLETGKPAKRSIECNCTVTKLKLLYAKVKGFTTAYLLDEELLTDPCLKAQHAQVTGNSKTIHEPNLNHSKTWYINQVMAVWVCGDFIQPSQELHFPWRCSLGESPDVVRPRNVFRCFLLQ